MPSNSERKGRVTQGRVMAGAILSSVLCSQLPAAAQTATETAVHTERRAKAARRFREGVRLYAAASYEAACAEFAASTKILVTKSGLFNLANCEYEVGRRIDAMTAVSRLLSEFGTVLTKEMRSDAQALQARLETELSRIAVSGTPSEAKIYIDDKLIAAETDWFTPGTHRLRVLAAGFQAYEAEIELVSGQTNPFSVELKPEPVIPAPASVDSLERRPGSSVTASVEPVWTRTEVWVSGATTLAFTGAALGFFFHASAIDKQLEDDFAAFELESPNDRQKHGELQSEQMRRDRSALIAYIGGGLAAAALATTGYFVWSASADSSDDQALRLSISPGNFSLSGQF